MTRRTGNRLRRRAVKSVAVAAITGFSLATPPLLAADFGVEVRDGRFVVGGSPMPSGCVQRLMTELNGDDVIRSVYLGRSSVRGCMDSNEPGREIDYTVNDVKSDGVYAVRACERVDGSM